MTTEQLNQARAEAWRQDGNPLLTADDAAAWLRETGVSFFLPRTAQLATAAPSFVEAVLGAADATPSLEAIGTATRLLERLLAAGDAIALNLTGAPGEQPDFIATIETLPFLYALLGDKEWKRGPRGKSSPLVIEVWKLLDRAGPLTAIDVKEQLGRQLTEAAALRALGDLWSHLRIEPVFKEGAPARWQLLERNRQKQMQAGSTMSQAVALSALVSLYLQSAVAASGEEVEIFLSPVASRSKVRDAVKGLTASRQLSTLNLGPVELYHVEGSLPEFPEIVRPEGAVVEAVGHSTDAEGGMGEGRRRFVAKRLAAEADASAPGAERADRGFAPRDKSATRSARPAAGRAAGKTTDPGAERGPVRGADRPSADRRPFAPRPGAPSVRKPYGTRNASGGSSFNPREPWTEDHKPAAPREGGERKPLTPREGSPGERKPFAARTGERPPRTGGKPFGERKSFGDRKPFAPREGGERKPFAAREGGAGERRPYNPREGGERKPFAPRGGDRPFKPRFDGKPFGEGKSFAPRGDGERKPFTPRGDGERKPFTPRSGDRPFKPRFDASPSGERKSFGGERKPFAPRQGGERKPFTPRKGGERKPFAPRGGEGGERKPFAPRGGNPFKPRSAGKPFTPREGGERKSYPPREGGSGDQKSFAPRGDKPFKPRADTKPFGERKSFGDRKPFAAREGADRKPFKPREGGSSKPFAPRGAFKPRTEDRTDRPSGSGEGRSPGLRPSFGAGRPAFGAGKPSAPGARKSTGVRKATSASRARTSPTTSTGKTRSGVRPPAGRPGPRATRGGAAGARPGFKRPGRPGGKGRSK